MNNPTDEKKPAGAGGRVTVGGGLARRPGVGASGVLAHGIDDGADLVKPQLDPAWGEVIFGSELAQKVGKDHLMLQWLYASAVFGSKPPTLKSELKCLFAELAAAVRSVFKPRRRYRRDSADQRATERKQAVDKGWVEARGVGCYSRPDAMIVIRRDDPANVTDVVW